MKYFGQDKTSNIKPINNTYKIINNPNDLYCLLEKCWCKQTCAPRMANDWCEDNITLGQCSITAFLVQDIFGGEVYGIDLKDGNYHCYNVIDGVAFDLTSAQFKEELEYKKENKQDRNNHFSSREKYDRYLLLKDKLNYLINKGE